MRRLNWLCCTTLLLALTSGPAWALEAGISIDVHQDIFLQQFWPNDFHIQGLICSNNGIPPLLVEHIDGPFTNFTHTITPLAGEPCWYWFEATWWLTGGYIPYCTVIHLGLLFDVEAANVIIDLSGWWTRDGMPVGSMYGGLQNQGFVPLLGFNVADFGEPQTLTIGNGDLPITPVLPPPLPPLPPWPPAPIPVQILQLDVVPFPPGAAPPLAEMTPLGGQQTWPWIPVVHPDGQPISPARPLALMPDSFFDIFLSAGPGFRPAQQFTVPPGGFLAARQLVRFFNNNGLMEERWFWEIHGAQDIEACCFPDEHCENIQPFVCLQRGGQPMGAGVLCAPGLCTQTPSGACCLMNGPTIYCVITQEQPCVAAGGEYQGDGTTCDDNNGNGVADACEAPIELGACCFQPVGAPPQCVIAPQAICETQFPNGQWQGPGTTCADLNGNGVADICEPSAGACCVNETCLQLPEAECVDMNGDFKGVGTPCFGDLNGNGRDDICELKWLQPPDLSTTGIDVLANQPLVLADDFLCTQHGLITDILVFGSWYHDLLPQQDPRQVVFTLSLHADIPDPDGNGPAFSMPGVPLWVRTFPPGSFGVLPFQTNLQEGFWNPMNPGSYEFPADTVCWLYHFPVPPAEAFCQLGTPEQPIVYWLDVQALPLGGAAKFGWKTSFEHWNDKAVWGMGVEPYLGPWNAMVNPPQHPQAGQAVDLAFALGGDLSCPCKGDLDCNGQVDFGDINPFVLRLSNPAAYFAQFPGCANANGDIDGNGVVDFGDINPFVSLLSSNPLPILCP